MPNTQNIAELAQLACIAEVCAPKAGNVHPRAEFEDVTWLDFIVSAMVVSPILSCAPQRGVGQTILQATAATAQVAAGNTNLGILLLLAPLCAVPIHDKPAQGIKEVLTSLTPQDTCAVYQAIRLAQPGGLGTVEHEDVARQPQVSLVEAMRLTAPRDTVAGQYVNGFDDVIRLIAPRLVDLYRAGQALDHTIVQVHLEQMARQPDSLILRKCGQAVADESQQRAAAVLTARLLSDERSAATFGDFDRWLRADVNRRNPGTSADLVAAGLFVALRSRQITHPFAWSDPGAGAAMS